MPKNTMIYMTPLDGAGGKLARASSPRPAARPPEYERPVQTAKSEKTEETYFHTVKKGENLFRIAMRYGVKVPDILKCNELPSEHKIKAGEKLLIITKGTGPLMPSEPVEGRKMRMKTSAYNSDERQTDDTPNITAYGTKTRWGIVAADPSILPRGTRLYIEGAGYFVVEDTGKKIKGNRIDIWMKDEKQAINWGKREVDVTVLED